MKITKEELTQLAQMAFSCAKGIVEGGEDAAPMILTVEPAYVFPLAFNSDADKDAVFGRLRRFLAATNAQAYVYVCEAWTLKLDGDQARADYFNGNLPRPSQSPHKIDSLQIDAWTRDGSHVVMWAEIKRTPHGRQVSEPTVEATTITVGRCANLFEAESYGSMQ